MVIYKKVSAWDALNEFSSDNWSKVGGLVKYCLDHSLESKFDEIANREFPNGCEEDDFKEWCFTDAEEDMRDVMNEGKYHIFNIEWDIDSNDYVELPDSLDIYVPNDVDDIDGYISNWLSNTYNFCHNGFNKAIIKRSGKNKNVMILNGKTYHLEYPKDGECCVRCQFKNECDKGNCPGKCYTDNKDGYWAKGL